MLYIPDVLRHYAECQDFSLDEPERIDNIGLDLPVQLQEFIQVIYPRSAQALC